MFKKKCPTGILVLYHSNVKRKEKCQLHCLLGYVYYNLNEDYFDLIFSSTINIC
jgi:hypothetical protein